MKDFLLTISAEIEIFLELRSWGNVNGKFL